jgi:prepilin-type N-terminal cleavage/methylation domain-containing protein
VETREKGFSLIELMVAMVVTLIISGAVFQLVTAGQSAFRKEPAVADRQQNIRMAMDILTQDLFQAGYGMPSFAQAFTNNLDGIGPMGAGGNDTDELEIFRASECPPMTVCQLNSDPSKSIVTKEKFSACYTMPAIVLMGNDSEWDLRWAESPGKGTVSKDCATSGDDTNDRHGHVVFPPGQAIALNPTDSFTAWQNPPTYMMLGMAIRYRVHVDADGIPNFERSTAGGELDADGNSTWQIIARGVEDFQVEYMNAAGWQNTPGTIDCAGTGGGGSHGGGGSGTGTTTGGCSAPTAADYDRLVRRVRVRLSARVTESGKMAGETASAALPDIANAIRGQLVTEIAPRPATTTLQMYDGAL